MVKKTIFLIPGASPEAAKTLFDAIKANLKTNYQIVELETADKNDFLSKTEKSERKILVGKSIGGRIAIYYQLE